MPWELIVAVCLLPVAAWSGYRIGRRKHRNRRRGHGERLQDGYIIGLNHLLNEQPDKAIDTFIEMLQVDSETVETHLALGNLFRKRGEVDRAIRLHQNIIARPALTPDKRNLALSELGHDYMAAGLYDRAESLFEELLKDPKHKASSLQQLLLIHQQTRDWLDAVEVAQQIQRVSGVKQESKIAHYYCELAESQRLAGDPKAALQSLRKAISIDKSSVRASLLLGELLIQSGNYKEALKHLQKIPSQDVNFLFEALPLIEQCYQEFRDRKGYRQFLRASLERGAGTSAALALAEELRRVEDDRAAGKFITDLIQRKPSLRGLKRLIELHIEHAPESSRSSLEILDQVVVKLIELKPVYSCEVCGFSSKQIYWNCPSCKNWGSIKPIQGIEGE